MRVINFLKTKNIIKISPNETLSQGLVHLNSSHDAGFVFDEEGKKFLGVINPYHCLINNSYPGNAKIEHCLFHPPRVRVNFPIAKVAQLMIESKVHYLPVFDEQDKFSGIVSARNILSHLSDSSLFNTRISEFLKTKNQTLLSVLEDDLISHAINLFKTHKVSKLVVINRDMKLKGILTYYDLIQFLVTPKRKTHRGDREGVKISFTYHKVKNLAKTYVLSLTTRDTLKDALKLILDKSIGSVVIADRLKHPVGIITTRDFLTLIARGRMEREFKIVEKNLSEESQRILGGFFNPLTSWLRKVPNLARAKLFIKEEKRGGVFKAVLSLIPQKGPMTVIREEGKNLIKVLKKLKKG
jgi:CBS domain-containing protein